MAKSKTKAAKKVSVKKQARIDIAKQLTSSLAAFKDILGKKKFESRVKKAARLFSEGIKAVPAKKTKAAKKKATPVEGTTEK